MVRVAHFQIGNAKVHVYLDQKKHLKEIYKIQKGFELESFFVFAKKDSVIKFLFNNFPKGKYKMIIKRIYII